MLTSLESKPSKLNSSLSFIETSLILSITKKVNNKILNLWIQYLPHGAVTVTGVLKANIGRGGRACSGIVGPVNAQRKSVCMYQSSEICISIKSHIKLQKMKGNQSSIFQASFITKARKNKNQLDLIITYDIRLPVF